LIAMRVLSRRDLELAFALPGAPFDFAGAPPDLGVVVTVLMG
jgi:hypothetical protein